MSDETPVYKEGEDVPVPDKGGWIDGETGPVFGGPPPPPPEPPITRKDQEPDRATPIRKTGKEG